MCGIWFRVGPMMPIHQPSHWIRALHHRGPEDTSIINLSGDITMGFTRLAINGVNSQGNQPFGKYQLCWMCNGEIYNWRQLASEHNIQELKSGSDCEILGHLYEKYKHNLTSFFRSLDGVFAMVIVDEERKQIIVARDPYGVRPLYGGVKFLYKHEQGNTFTVGTDTLFFASEIKALIPLCDHIAPFPPGSYQVIDIATKKVLYTERYHHIHWVQNPLYSSFFPTGLDMSCIALRFALQDAVRKRMLTERPVAALLSGGIDSSLIASLVQRELMCMSLPPLKTFSIGMAGSTDLKYAKMVADWIKSDHTEIVLTAEEFFQAIPSVIRAIETYDTTTVRASVGNWLVCKKIKELTDCKVIFNGDGSDEVFGSYLYFYNAPNNREFEEESARLLEDIHYFDVLRSDRCISSHGLEPRTPYLDKQFVAVARSICSEWRRPCKGYQMEKWILRRAFDDSYTLPREVLYRKKEAFSDGVSSQEKSWYEIIQEKVASHVPANWKETAERRYEHLPPQTAEQYYYRFFFEAEFSKVAAKTCVPYFWMPKWSPGATDPSARTLQVYTSTG